MYRYTPATEKAKQRRRIELIDMKPAGLELVFTGRYAHPRLIERADLCTEMREVK
ncbi:MAG: ATP:corrinoid adenosyltransferase, partial [Deltaproteobacteria bacterium]